MGLFEEFRNFPGEDWEFVALGGKGHRRAGTIWGTYSICFSLRKFKLMHEMEVTKCSASLHTFFLVMALPPQ